MPLHEHTSTNANNRSSTSQADAEGDDENEEEDENAHQHDHEIIKHTNTVPKQSRWAALHNAQHDTSEAENGQTHRKRKLHSASKAFMLIRRAAHAFGSHAAHDGQAAVPSTLLRDHADTNTSNTTMILVPKLNALKLPLVCLVRSLDGELMREVFVHRYEQGAYIIESLKVSLGMQDCKYFGLKLVRSLDEQDSSSAPWLDLNESIYKQLSKHSKWLTSRPQSPALDKITFSGSNNSNSETAAETTPAPELNGAQRSIELVLRIKYYPPNMTRVQDAFLRQYLWLQLRRDLRLGKLTSSMNNLSLLMACLLQHELGDYDESLVDERIAQLQLLPNQDLIEEQAVRLWRTQLSGCLRHQAQMQFLRTAVILETYGFDYYPVRDHQRQRAYLLGFNYAGVKTIRNGRIVHHFRWHSLTKVSYERRMIIFHNCPPENSKRKQILGFKCLSNDDCQTLYMRLLEQKYFFTVDLAYFDQSVRRPSTMCLQQQQQQLHAAGMSSSTLDWAPSFERTDDSMSASIAIAPPVPVASAHSASYDALHHATASHHNDHHHQQQQHQQQHRQREPNAITSQADCETCSGTQATRHESTLAEFNKSASFDDQMTAQHRQHLATALKQPDLHLNRPKICRQNSTCDRDNTSPHTPQNRSYLSHLRAFGPTTKRALDMLELALIEPSLRVQRHMLRANSSPSLSHLSAEQRHCANAQEARELSESASSLVASFVRLCVLLVVLNFVLRLTDGLSSVLIDLFTLPSPRS